MDALFVTVAVVITIAWIGLFYFYIRTVNRQKELIQELNELENEFAEMKQTLQSKK